MQLPGQRCHSGRLHTKHSGRVRRRHCNYHSHLLLRLLQHKKSQNLSQTNHLRESNAKRNERHEREICLKKKRKKKTKIQYYTFILKFIFNPKKKTKTKYLEIKIIFS